jgi:hypothetical protein
VWSKAGRFVEGLHWVGDFLQLLKDKYSELCFDHDLARMCCIYYHVFRCVNELMMNAMTGLIIAVTICFTLRIKCV